MYHKLFFIHTSVESRWPRTVCGGSLLERPVVPTVDVIRLKVTMMMMMGVLYYVPTFHSDDRLPDSLREVSAPQCTVYLAFCRGLGSQSTRGNNQLSGQR